MSRRARSNPLIVCSVCVVVLFLTVVTAGGKTKDGKALFVDNGCSGCHSVAAAKIESKTKSASMRGPDLSGFKTDNDFRELAAFLRKEADLDGESHKKPFKGTDEELQAIVDWLGSLEAQK